MRNLTTDLVIERKIGWEFLSILVKLNFMDQHHRFLMKCLYMEDSRRYIGSQQSDTATRGDIDENYT
jgi:hypothetical protein